MVHSGRIQQSGTIMSAVKSERVDHNVSTTTSDEETRLFIAKMQQLDRMARQENPFYNCCYSLDACRGIAKALQMLYPKGRSNGKPPSQATIDKVRRFLKVKVKRYTQLQPQSSSLPTVEQLMLSNLFEADPALYSHLRIGGKEYLDPSVLPKTIWLACCALNIQAEMKTNPNAQVPIDSEGRFIATIHESNVPDIAHWLMTYCVIPGGPWSVYGAVRGGLSVSPAETDHFATMQRRLLQSDDDSNHSKIQFMSQGLKRVDMCYEW